MKKLFASTPPLSGIGVPQPGSPYPLQEDILDIYGPIPLPEPTPYVLYGTIILALLLLSSLGYFIYRHLKGRKKASVIIDPADTALSSLIRAESNLATSGVVVFANEISNILRTYIEARFNLPSMTCTTNEFFLRLKSSSQSDSLPNLRKHDELQQWFVLCDKIKFSRFHPEHASIKMLSEHARQFVETTRLKRQGEE